MFNWTSAGVETYIDDVMVANKTLDATDEQFYLVLNVAVGGTSQYFPNERCDKSWSIGQFDAVNAFWNNREQWQPSWEGDAAAMKIDHIRVYPYGADALAGATFAPNQDNE